MAEEDDGFGTGGAARDGEPSASSNGNGGGDALADRPAPETEEEDDGQVAFVVERGKRVTLSSLYSRNVPVEYEFKLDGKGVKGDKGMSLISFTDPDMTLVVPGRAGKVTVDPTYDSDGTVKKVVVRQHFKPTTLYDAKTEAAMVALQGEGEPVPA